MPTLSAEEGREKSGKILEVFDDVRAFLSDQVLRSIPDGIETFFQENGVPGKLHEDVSTTCLRYLIQGSFLDILTAREILQKHVLQQDVIGPCQISDAEEVTLSIAFQDGIQDPCGDDVASHEVISTNDADDSTELAVKEEAFNLSSKTTLLVNVVPDPNDCGDFCPTDLQHAFQEVKAVADDGVLEQVEQNDSSSVPLPDPMVIEIHCSKLEDAMLDLPVGISTTEDGTEPAADLHDAGKEAAQETVGQRRKRNYEQVTPFKYFCEMCSFKTKRNSHYIKHMKIHEKVKTLHNCDKCAFTTLRLGHLRRHEATHSNLLHHCSHCSYATDDQKLLLRHNRMRHYCVKRPRVAPAKPMECPHCSYRTTRPLLLARHRQRHSGDSATSQGPLHQCAQCGYQTHRKEHLVRHRTNVHGGARPFLCHRCGKAFKRADALRQHHLTHGANSQESDDGVPRASFPCTQCHKVFRTHSHLTEHKAIHSTARPFLCEICGSAFKTRSVQRKHVQSVHRNPRAFCCACCGKKFNTQYALKRHQKLHSSHGTEEEDAPVAEAAAPPFSDVLDCGASVVSGAPAAEVAGLERVITTVPVQDSCDVISHISSTMLQPVETATLLYLTNTLPPF